MIVSRCSFFRSLFSLAGALLLGLGLFAAPEASSSAPSASSALDPSRTPALTRVRIQHQLDTVELFKCDGRWWVADRGVPARADMVTQTLRQLEALAANPVRTLGKKESLEPYGLHVEAARFVRLQFSDGKIVRLRLGVRPDEKNAIYWARDVGDPLSAKTPEPREILRGAGFLIATNLDSWISPLLIDTTFTRDLRTLRVEWLDSAGRPVRYALEREPGTGRLVLADPRGLQANPVKAAEAFAQVGSLLIEGFHEGKGGAPAAGAAPRVRVTVEDKNGRSITLAPEFSDDFHDYVRHPQAADVLVKMRRVQFDSFRHTPLFLATSYPYGPEEDDGISGPPPPHFAVWAPHTHDHYYDPEDPEHHDRGDHEHEHGHDHGHEHVHDHEQGGHGQPQDTTSGVKAKSGHEGHRH